MADNFYYQNDRSSQRDIAPGSIKDRHIDSLSFDKAIGGTLTLGGVSNVSGLFKINNASNNTIVQGDNLGHHYYDTSGHELARLNSNGLSGYDISGNQIVLLNTDGLSIFNTSLVKKAKLDASGVTVYDASSLRFYDNSVPGVVGYLGSDGSSNVAFQPSGPGIGFKVPAGHFFVGNNRLDINSGTTVIDNNGSVATIVNNGKTKTAIVPTSTGYNALYCTESPEVWFMDFAQIIRPKFWKFWKKSIIKCDSLFLEVTEKPYITTQTTNKNIVQIWGKRKGFANIRSEKKTKEEFDKNNEFWKMPQVDK